MIGVKVNKDNSRWYPVYTHAKSEKKAQLALLNKGIDVYLPLQRQLKQWSDRKKWIEEPLIKSYLFVHIKESEFTEVLMTKGISRFIYFSGKVASIPENQLDNLKLLMANPLDLEITEENLQPGEKVTVKGGALKGLTGEMVSYRSQRQLALRFENMGYTIIIHIAASLIERYQVKG